MEKQSHRFPLMAENGNLYAESGAPLGIVSEKSQPERRSSLSTFRKCYRAYYSHVSIHCLDFYNRGGMISIARSEAQRLSR